MGLPRHLLWAGVLRASLQLLDASAWFDLFPGITTPVTSYLQVNEGLWLSSNGYSPYHSPLVHTQPLSLMIFGAIGKVSWLPGAAAIAADLCSAVLINRITGGTHVQPTTSSLLFLWSPFSILPCVATSLSTFSAVWVLLAIYAALRGRGHLSAWGLAVATYLDLHPVLLLVPLMLLLKNGPENLQPDIEHILKQPPHASLPNQPSSSDPDTKQPTETAGTGSSTEGGTVQSIRTEPSSSTTDRSSARCTSQRSVAGCLGFFVQYVVWLLVLLLASEARMRPYPENQCLLPRLKQLGERREGGRANTTVAGAGGSCWMLRSYWDILNVADLTPNIGLFWYFFLEIFTAFRAFFILVFHSQVLCLITPLAIRFGHRPILLLVICLLYIATFKPYPSMSDLALYQSFLPLLYPQFRLSKVALPLAVLFAVLLVLIPAMWWQWLVVESANANFFYSVTLLLGAFHVLFQAHILNCTVKLDRLIAGKPVAGYDVGKKTQ